MNLTFNFTTKLSGDEQGHYIS